MDRLSFLQREVVEGPRREPPMPSQQVAAHLREIDLLQREFSIELPKASIDWSHLRSLGHIAGCPFYDYDGNNLAA